MREREREKDLALDRQCFTAFQFQSNSLRQTESAIRFDIEEILVEIFPMFACVILLPGCCCCWVGGKRLPDVGHAQWTISQLCDCAAVRPFSDLFSA
jgi:hypothetical protein